jgi:hypothetical protein
LPKRWAEHGESVHVAYDQGGLKALEPKPVGGRHRENMTLAEEKTLLAGFAKSAGDTSNSTVFFCNGPLVVNLFLRHPVSGSRFCPGSAQGRHLMGSE